MSDSARPPQGRGDDVTDRRNRRRLLRGCLPWCSSVIATVPPGTSGAAGWMTAAYEWFGSEPSQPVSLSRSRRPIALPSESASARASGTARRRPPGGAASTARRVTMKEP
ncbi:MAG: hypothetical protein DMF81_19785 [Acidobacteria bacterium]|nr:MAG: hypothetical protein DMF81_19785 [Acidobacteriota bacterium]